MSAAVLVFCLVGLFYDLDHGFKGFFFYAITCLNSLLLDFEAFSYRSRLPLTD